MNILFVDDDNDVLTQAELYLEKKNENFEIETVNLAEKGLDMLEEDQYDIIISDYQMPKMDGLEFLESVREEMDEDIPFIMFTGKGREEVAMKALNLGANRYIQKGGKARSQYGVLSDAIKQENDMYSNKRELEKSEKEKSKILNSTVELVAYQNENHEIIWANKSAGDSVDEDPEDLRGRKCYEIWNNKDEPCENCPVERSYETEDIERGEIHTYDGGRWLITSNPIIDESGDIEGVVEVALDITERKEVEEALKEKENQYRALVETAFAGISITDVNENLTYVNERFSEMLGYDKEELTGKNLEDISQSEALIKFKKETEKRKEGKTSIYKSELYKKNGEPVKVMINASPFRDGSGDFTGTIGVITDITEREETKQKLKELHEVSSRLENTNSEDKVCEIAADAAENVLDFSVCSLVFIDESGNRSIKAASKAVNRDDYVVPVSGKDTIMGKTFYENKSYLIDDLQSNDIAKPARKDYRSALSVPIKGKGVFQAISSEKGAFDERDLEMAELLIDHVSEALERLEMRKREEFLHSLLRHDVRNKEVLAQGYLELIEDFDMPEEVEEYLEKAKKATRNGLEVIDKVRKLRKIEKENEITEVDLNNTLDQVISEHQDQLKDKDINLEFEGSTCNVKGGALLKELFSNIIENSIRHSNCSEIKITIESRDEYCEVIIEDDGKGIKENKKDKIFERGFKGEDSAGSGLGMYMVKKIAKNYQGDIKINDSELGGARFDVRLKKT